MKTVEDWADKGNYHASYSCLLSLLEPTTKLLDVMVIKV